MKDLKKKILLYFFNIKGCALIMCKYELQKDDNFLLLF